MHLISATISEAAYEIRSRWPSRQKSANTSAAIIFYEENGPGNLQGLWHSFYAWCCLKRGLCGWMVAVTLGFAEKVILFFDFF